MGRAPKTVPNRETPEHRTAAIEGAHGTLGSCKFNERNTRRVMRLSEQPRLRNRAACLLEEGVDLLAVNLQRTEAYIYIYAHAWEQRGGTRGIRVSDDSGVHNVSAKQVQWLTHVLVSMIAAGHQLDVQFYRYLSRKLSCCTSRARPATAGGRLGSLVQLVSSKAGPGAAGS